MNNSVFGRTMENIRKHRNIKLVMTEEKYLCTVIHSNFKSGVLFGENLMGCRDGKDQSSYEQTGLSRPSNPRSQQDRNVSVSLRLHGS